MSCANCGLINAQTARFCVRCGVPLAAAAAQQAAPYQPAPAAPQTAPFHPAPAPGEATYPYGAPAYPVHPSQQMMPTQRGMYHQAPYAQQTGGNPPLAAVMSLFIPGLGQLYNGEGKKAAVMFGAALVGILFLGLGWLAMMIWGAIDAWQVASGTGKRWD
jgi:TM2 domain-containing membrane protein YozV